MPSLSKSLSLGQAANVSSSITDKAAQLITNIQSTFERRNAVVRKVANIIGHQFEGAILTEPTKCPHCNQIIWGVLAQRCKLCKLVSHQKCLQNVESKCIKSTQVNELLSKLQHNFVIKTLKSLTMCDHCGTLIKGLFRQGVECSSCLRNIHHDCVQLIARECHIRITEPTNRQDCQPNDQQNQCRQASFEYRHMSRLNIEEFNILKLLGTGSFSKVYLAEFKDKSRYGDEKFAIKVIKKTNLVVNSDPSSVFMEWDTLNVGRKYPFLAIAHCCFQSRDRLYFVMEHVIGRDLVYHIGKSRKFTEDRTRFYSAEIVLALMFLHNQRIVYRDLKLDNIILDKYGHIKLLDFGMSKLLDNDSMRTRTFCGTPSYISPEIIRGEDYDYSVDWWSLGILIFEMLTGYSPFEAPTEEALYDLIKFGEIHYPSSLSDRARSILEGLLTKEAQNRLGCQLMEGCAMAIREHPFFLFRIKDNSGTYEVHQWEALEVKSLRPPYIPTSEDLEIMNTHGDFNYESQVDLTPIGSSELRGISQTEFENFSFYSRSFSDLNFESH